jgi:ketosteroid isomerase-like protein
MASRREEVLRQAFEAWNRGDFEATAANLTEDFEWHSSGVFPDFDSVYLGRERFREFWDRFHDAWAFIDVEPKGFWEVGDTIVMAFRFHAKGKESGVEVKLDWVNVFRFNADDKAVYGAAYQGLDAALAGEGISREELPPDATADRD